MIYHNKNADLSSTDCFVVLWTPRNDSYRLFVIARGEWSVQSNPYNRHVILTPSAAEGEGSIFGFHFQGLRHYHLNCIWILRSAQNDNIVDCHCEDAEYLWQSELTITDPLPDPYSANAA